MSDLSEAILRETARPSRAGIGASATAFVGTVIGTSPLRVQLAVGIDVEAVAPIGQALATNDNVLVIAVGSTHFAFEIP